MPCQPPRQEAADALHWAYLLSVIVEAEAAQHTAYESSSELSSSSSSSDLDDVAFTESAGSTYLNLLGDLYSKYYLAEQNPINKSKEDLNLLLTDWNFSRPEIFQSYLWVTPTTFDDILAAIEDDKVFQNDSPNKQEAVERQLVIALFHFGHYENAASTMKVVLWAGVGYGSVRLFTIQVMVGIC